MHESEAENRESPTVAKPDAFDRQFQVWSKSEDVAIHFNDLIMRWRLQALGGLAAITTLAGFVVGDADSLGARYRAMFMLSGLLACAWLGVASLDLLYYRKLLAGAVKNILALEASMPAVQLSTSIEHEAASGAKWAPWLFYLLGLLPLLGFMWWARSQLESTPADELNRTRKHPEIFEPLRSGHQSHPAEISPLREGARGVP